MTQGLNSLREDTLHILKKVKKYAKCYSSYAGTHYSYDTKIKNTERLKTSFNRLSSQQMLYLNKKLYLRNELSGTPIKHATYQLFNVLSRGYFKRCGVLVT